MAIEAGTLVEAMTASGEAVVMCATGTPLQGRDFPVVWLCTRDEFAEDAETRGVPWPLDAVTEIVPAERPGQEGSSIR